MSTTSKPRNKWIAFAVVAVAVVCGGWIHQAQRAEEDRHADAAVQAIEVYLAQHKRCPSSIAEVGLADLRDELERYSFTCEDGKPEFRIHTFGRSYRWYDFTNRSWEFHPD